MSDIREQVRKSYAASAIAAAAGEKLDASAPAGCCGDAASSCPGNSGDVFGSGLYEAGETDALPDKAVLASLGCGNPTAVAELSLGETVLDLGSGGGIDVLLSARRVGPTGKVYGIDMTEEMLALALENKAKAGTENVEFLKGYIEDIPLPANTIDVVISNCVINLAADKAPVFSEMFRILKPGGRIGVSDVVADDGLSLEERAERGSHVGCIAGALTFSEYEEGLTAAGFSDVSVTTTHEVTDGMHSAIVKATKPEGIGKELPIVDSSAACC
jgi:SAM-dependent methyltransferase